MGLLAEHTLVLCSKDRIPVGEDGYRYRPVLTLKFSKVDELTACAWEHMDNLRYPFAWHATLDLDAVTLAEYMRVQNLNADWLDENPIDGTWVGRLEFDEGEFKSARAADDYLFWTSYSDVYKSKHGFRPRFDPSMTREEATRLLEAA